MNSIRPLVTITFLALVGVFLYMKINETDPVLPAEFAEYSIPSGVNISDAPSFMTNSDDLVPKFNSRGSEPSFAPAYSANTMDEAPPAFVPKAAVAPPDEAPKFEVAAAGPSDEAAKPPANTKPDTEDNLLPNLPPLPAIPTSSEPKYFQDSTARDSATDPNEDQPEDFVSEQQPAEIQETPREVPTNSAGLGDRYGNYLPSTAADSEPSSATSDYETSDYDTAITPTEQSPVTSSVANESQSSLFSATRLAVQAALDRGELSQALLLLSDWHGDPSLSASESQEVENLLGQLAGSVIYSTEHRIEPPYMVQAGETLENIGEKFNVPWQLLAKINGLDRPDAAQPGQQLKVVRGPFSARVDLGSRKMTLMLDRRYAGQFQLEVEPGTSIEEGYWTVNQKLVTPGNAGSSSSLNQEERSLLLTNSSGTSSQVTLIRGPGAGASTADPSGRVLQMKPGDVEDVFDILTVGSQVVIRR